MLAKSKKLMIIIFGFCFLLLGLIFMVLPGPAIIFLPLGLALLSTEYQWAKVWLKRCQKWMKKTALAMDNLLRKRRFK
jgi:uncharacterized membrane protein YbaN (DUF454 family)